MYYLIAKKRRTDDFYSVYWSDSLEDAAAVLKTFISHGILTYMTIGDNREEQPIPGYNCLSIDDCERR